MFGLEKFKKGLYCMLCVSEWRGAGLVHLEPEKEALQIITDHLSLNWLEDFALVF